MILVIFIGTVLILILCIPVAILILVRPKKMVHPNSEEQVEKIDQNNDDSNPYLPDTEAPVTQTNANVIVIVLLVISLFSYVSACISPLDTGKQYPGFAALTFGIFMLPLWIPNPLYLIGWSLAVRGRYKLASSFGMIASILAAVVVWGNFPFKQKWVGTLGGPATIFWVLSMTALVVACTFGMFCSKP